MRLEDEVDVGAKLDALAVGHGEQPVVVEHRVERLDPLGINIAVADDPALDIRKLLHHLAGGGGQHAIEPLARVVVHDAEQLVARHRLWVHHVRRDRAAKLGERELEHTPHGRLAAARRADHHHAHPVLRRLIELDDFGHLQRELLELFLLLVRDVSYGGAGEYVGDERVKGGGVAVGELGQGVDPKRLDQQLLLHLPRDLLALAELLFLGLNELAADAEHRLERAQAPVVVLLRCEQLLRELEDSNELGRERLGVYKALGRHLHLRDELIVRLGHGHRAEERLEVVRQLRPAKVAFTGRVERHKDAGVELDLVHPAKQLHGRVAAFDGVLDYLDLLRDLGELPQAPHLMRPTKMRPIDLESMPSSQLKTSTCRPKALPSALTDSVLPVPAGPYGLPP
eukprot:scaffold5708_cov107-Isochrysis_galbana.AAC.11